jgi:hypothetical protein
VGAFINSLGDRPERSTHNTGVFYQSLLAPPALDQIWILIIRMHKVYAKFCNEMFGGYVDRRYFHGVESPTYESYSYTLDLMNKHADILCPFPKLWPEYNVSCYFADYFVTCYIDPRIIPNMTKYVELSQDTTTHDFKPCKFKVKNVSRKVIKKF